MEWLMNYFEVIPCLPIYQFIRLSNPRQAIMSAHLIEETYRILTLGKWEKETDSLYYLVGQI